MARVRSPFVESPEFRRLVEGDPRADLTRVALEIAADAYPGLEARPYLDRIDDLAGRVRERCPAGARARRVLGQINWVLFVEERFRGNADAYYDPRNSYLNEVLDRKVGIPISLSVLYLAVADRLGLRMAGVNLPAHFVLRTLEPGDPLFVDPFHTGALLDAEGCSRRIAELTGRPVSLTDSQLDPCATPTVVARMLRNLKAIYIQADDYASAVPVLRRLAAVRVDDPAESRDWGMVSLYAGRPGEAVAPLQAYLDACPEADDSDAIRSLLRVARNEIAHRN